MSSSTVIPRNYFPANVDPDDVYQYCLMTHFPDEEFEKKLQKDADMWIEIIKNLKINVFDGLTRNEKIQKIFDWKKVNFEKIFRQYNPYHYPIYSRSLFHLDYRDHDYGKELDDFYDTLILDPDEPNPYYTPCQLRLIGRKLVVWFALHKDPWAAPIVNIHFDDVLVRWYNEKYGVDFFGTERKECE